MHRIRRIGCVAALCVALAGLAVSAAGADDGEAAFKARCSECHGPRDILHWGRQRSDAAARQAWLDQFLRRHYPPSDAERSLIIGYIQATIVGQAAPK
jgi:mono/diheme cytochrome c family protein